MADFSAVLKKTIEALRENTPEARERVYEKARSTIEAKLAAINPPPSAAVVKRQNKLLEDAITVVEAEYATPEPIAEDVPEAGADDLDHVFAELEGRSDGPDQPIVPEAATPVEPEAAEPVDTAPETADAAADESVAVPALGNDPLPGSFHAVQEPAAAPDEAPSSVVGDNVSGGDQDTLPPLRPRKRAARKSGRTTALVVVLLVLTAIAAIAWYLRSDLSRLANFEPTQQTSGEPAAQPASGGENAGTTGQPEASAEASGQETPQTQQTPAASRPSKFTQRLLPDGREIDEGPAGGEPGLGEGTSVAQATVPGADDAPATAETQTAEPGTGTTSTTGEAQSPQGLPVGQKAIYYEERTNVSQGSADRGAVVWSVVQESPGNNRPQEPAIRAEATIPDKNLQLKLTIRRNADESLPASHIVEIIFLTPDDFEGGGIDNVLRVTMKRSEQDTGSPLLGIPAKIADGFFLIALSDSRADIETNTLLMRRQSWIDIPVIYKSGRRALITIEKGIPGDKAFTDVLNGWQADAEADNG